MVKKIKVKDLIRRNNKDILVFLLIVALTFSSACSPKEVAEITLNFPEDTEGIVWFADDSFQPHDDSVSVKMMDCDGIIIFQKNDGGLNPYIIEHVDKNETVKVDVEGDSEYKVGVVNRGIENCTLMIENVTLHEKQLQQNAIERNTLISNYKSMKEMIPHASFFVPYTGDLWRSGDEKVEVSSVNVAEDGSGMIVIVDTTSFGGKLTEMIGIDRNGEVVGVKILSHGDTPGVGTEAMTDAYLSQYIGITELFSTSVKNASNINHISGATVSSDGIHYGIYAALKQHVLMIED